MNAWPISSRHFASSLEVDPINELAVVVTLALVTLVVALAVGVHSVVGTLGEAVLGRAIVGDDYKTVSQ